ncbi:MAG: sulfatase, partial [Cyanothece sp. SIO1E1]|nr:sulfatase [Cyanothece sp. SIO1E1]
QRAVRSKRYKYIRYYEPYKPFCQYMNTPEKGGIMQAIRQASQDNSLPEAGTHIVASSKPAEELFDLEADPWELKNLAEDPNYAAQLEEMRAAHAEWSDRTKDTGLIPETILRRWEKDYNKSIYAIMRQDSIPVSLIRNIAIGELELEPWLTALQNPNAAVRYWAAIRLGNDERVANHISSLRQHLADSIPLVRIAVARALCLAGVEKFGLPVLQKELQHADEWVRLSSAIVIDEMQEQARPAVEDLQSVMEDPNKYVVRVANHALNALLGTTNTVP